MRGEFRPVANPSREYRFSALTVSVACSLPTVSEYRSISQRTGEIGFRKQRRRFPVEAYANAAIRRGGVQHDAQRRGQHIPRRHPAHSGRQVTVQAIRSPISANAEIAPITPRTSPLPFSSARTSAKGNTRTVSRKGQERHFCGAGRRRPASAPMSSANAAARIRALSAKHAAGKRDRRHPLKRPERSVQRVFRAADQRMTSTASRPQRREQQRLRLDQRGNTKGNQRAAVVLLICVQRAKHDQQRDKSNQSVPTLRNR